MTSAGAAEVIDGDPTLGRFKYGTELANASSMPDTKPARGVAFRIVHDPILPTDFLPQAKLRSADATNYSSWALSMFTNRHSATKKLDGLVSRHPQLKSTLGDHIAEGDLQPSLGEATKANANRHFEFFEYVDCDLQHVFNLVR